MAFAGSSSRGYTFCRFFIAVKELITEWQDYQTEVCGYIHCDACEDFIDKSLHFNHAILDETEMQGKNKKACKEILRFVKSPGLKTTVVKVNAADLKFHPIDLKPCKIEREVKNKE